MFRIKLPRRWTDYLLTQPESGMGYQRVVVRFRDGRILDSAIVFNSEELEAPDPIRIRPDDIVDIRIAS
jgi:hypothetical protein